jgi:spore coat protein U-like protein
MVIKNFRKLTSMSMLAVSLCVAMMTQPMTAKAGSQTAQTQANATISSTCVIVAQNLNFGALNLPLSSQSASTSMNVQCSKNASYTVNLAYGGVYGQGGVSGTLPNTAGGKVTGGSSCTYSGYINGVYYSENEYIYGSPYCPASTSYATPSYAYGKMIGAAKGDNIGYSIQVPNNPGQIWNAGNAAYRSTGTGASQTIPVVGTLVPAQSGSSYPTPDAYMDTVTATVSF